MAAKCRSALPAIDGKSDATSLRQHRSVFSEKEIGAAINDDTDPKPPVGWKRIQIPARGSPLENSAKRRAGQVAPDTLPRAVLKVMSDCSFAQLARLPGHIFTLWVPAPKKNWTSLVVQIRPRKEGCPWKDCAYRFKFVFPWKHPPRDYPSAPPVVSLLKDYSIYHPNFHLRTGACRVLQSVWDGVRGSQQRIAKACWALHDVFVQPELSDPALILNPIAATQLLDRPDAFKKTVRAGLVGERIPLQLRSNGRKKIIRREFQFTTIASMKTRASRGGKVNWKLIHGS